MTFLENNVDLSRTTALFVTIRKLETVTRLSDINIDVHWIQTKLMAVMESQYAC